MAPRPHKSSAKAKILDAALMVIRAKGYAATTVDDLCAASDVTKGAFFHHFKSKEDLAVAAAEHWSKVTGELFEAAPYHRHADPLQRVLGYLEFRKQLLTGEVAEFTCLVGTMVQETFRVESGNSSRLRRQHQRARGRRSRPTSPRRCSNAAFAGSGLQKALPCTRKQSSRAPSYWPRRRTTRRLPRPASIICAATSSSYSIQTDRKENDHENHRRDQRRGSHRAGLGCLHHARGHQAVECRLRRLAHDHAPRSICAREASSLRAWRRRTAAWASISPAPIPRSSRTS